jgi:3-isopropylmalate dehydrogenase
MTRTIVFLPGDGIGPEITAIAKRLAQTISDHFDLSLRITEHAFGGASIDQFGEPLTDETLQACLSANAVFLGAVGGPKWDQATARPEAGLLALRKALGVYANLRPVAVHPALAHRSPLRPERVANIDILVVRELTGGVYFGARKRTQTSASDTCTYSVSEIERVAHIAFQQARRRRAKLTSVDKANVLETSRLWREVVTRMGKTIYPDITLDHMYIDAAAMHLLRDPASFDVVLTENMFGDILSDEASMLPGSIGLLGSASLGDQAPGLFEPIHGSAPDIAGQDRANPFGAIEAMAQLFESGLDEPRAAMSIRSAVNTMHEAGAWTEDLGGPLSCTQAGDRFLQCLKTSLPAHQAA